MLGPLARRATPPLLVQDLVDIGRLGSVGPIRRGGLDEALLFQIADGLHRCSPGHLGLPGQRHYPGETRSIHVGIATE